MGFPRLMCTMAMTAVLICGLRNAEELSSPGEPGAQMLQEAAPEPGIDTVARREEALGVAEYSIEPPDVLQIEVQGALTPAIGRQVSGEHLVRSDGTVSLGIYGPLSVLGLTREDAGRAIRNHLARFVPQEPLQVQVAVESYNSKVCYVITDNCRNAQIYRFPLGAGDRVLDVLSPLVDKERVRISQQVWISRPVADGGCQTLPVDWLAIRRGGSTATNYLLQPGDRIHVSKNRSKGERTGKQGAE